MKGFIGHELLIDADEELGKLEIAKTTSKTYIQYQKLEDVSWKEYESL